MPPSPAVLDYEEVWKMDGQVEANAEEKSQGKTLLSIFVRIMSRR